MMVYAEQAAETVAASSSGPEDLIIFSIIVNIIIFAFGYGKLSNEVKNTKSAVKNIKEDLESAVKNVKEEIRSVKGDMESAISNIKEDVNRRLDKQGEKIDRVAEDLAELRGTFLAFKGMTATQKMSPITLTKRGDEILQDSGGDVILKNLFEELYPRFEGITNAYDIQRKAKKVIEDLFDEGDAFEKVKDYLYDGEEGFGTVVEVLGIELRDMVFERRGMPVKKRTDEPEPSVVRDGSK